MNDHKQPFEGENEQDLQADMKGDISEIEVENDAIAYIDEDQLLKSQKPGLGLFSRFTKAITEPAAMIEDVSRVPKLLLPFIVLMILSTLTVLINMEGIMELQRQALINAYRENGMKIPSDGFDGMLATTRYFTIAVSGLSAVVAVALTSVISHLIAGFFGSEGTVKKVMSAFSYAYIIPLSGAILGAVVSVLAGIDYVSFGPAMILGVEQMGTPMYSLLAALDIFSLWYVGISILCIKKIEEISVAKASICVLIPYMAGIIINIIAS